MVKAQSRLLTSIKSVSTKEQTVRAIVAAPTLDRDGEVIDTYTSRWPLKAGGFVLGRDLDGSQELDVPFQLDHSKSVKDTIGSVRRGWMQPDGKIEVEFGVSSVEEGQRSLTLLDEGHLGNAFSISYTYTWDDVRDFSVYNVEVTEVSLVYKGANYDARLIAVSKSLKEGASMSKKDTEEIAKKREKAKALVEEAEALNEEIKADEKNAEEEAKNESQGSEQKTEEERVKEEAEAKAKADQEAADQKAADEKEAAEKAAEEEKTKAEEKAEAEKAAKAQAEAKKTQKGEEKMTEKEKIEAAKSAAKANAGGVNDEAKQGEKAESHDKYGLAAAQFVAFVNKDHKELTRLNEKALATHSKLEGNKASYMNTGVTADGGAIVPSAELLTDVYTTLGEFSTVSNDLRVVTLTSGDSIDVATLITDVVVTEVSAEGGDKDVTKPVLGDGEVSLREFAGIAIITKKLVRQASINVYELLRESFARAIANRRAVLALTDEDSGIVNKEGVEEVVASGNTVDEYTYQDIKKMSYAIPAAAVQGGKYYISRELLGVLDQLTDEQGRELDILTLDGDGLSGRFKNGFKFVVEEVLGQGEIPHAVFGSMGRFGILLRQATVESETFDTGTVVDNSDVTHNLLQQNKLAQRVAFYENVGYPLPGAFAVLVESGS